MEKQIVYGVLTVARQIDGEFIFIRTEKAFTTASRADAYKKELDAKYSPGGVPKSIRLETPEGAADCLVTPGGFTIEVEE